MASRSKYLWLVTVLLLGLFAYGGYQWGSASLTRQQKSEGSSTTSTEETKSEGGRNSGITADGVNDFNACSDDIDLYCSEFFSQNWAELAAEEGYVTASWKLGLVDCLEQHRDVTTQACDDARDRRSELNENVNTICAEDRGTYCRGVEPEPGSEPQIDCLMEHIEEVTPACADALFDHQNAQLLE